MATMTLKILWLEKQDMRRVQVVAVNQTLSELDQRVIQNWNALRFQDLRDYVELVFPELQKPAVPPRELLLYYTDDDDEQVRITNDAELFEAFRLMEEIAAASGKATGSSVVCKITVVTRPLEPTTATAAGAVDTQMMKDSQQKKINDLFVDMCHIVEKSPAQDEIKRDVLSLLHEPGCQDALVQVMVNPKFASLVEKVNEEYRKGGTFVSCLLAAAGTGELEEIAKILLQKCPQARVQIERVLQHVQHTHNVQRMSTSDFFESIAIEDTKQDEGPIVAVFEGDVTCPDGTVLAPHEPFDKVWKLRNAGPSKWPVGSKLLCVGGDKMQAPESVLIPSVLPGSSIDISLRMIAPTASGRYTGYWRLCTPDGTRFGQRLWVDINVMDPNELLDGSRLPAAEALPIAVRVDAPAPVVQAAAAGGQVSVPAPAPVVVASDGNREEVDLRWVTELQALQDMGFMDMARNRALLAQHQGSLDAVISALLQ